MTYIILDIDTYYLIIEKIKFYTKYEYDNGMRELLNQIEEDRLDEVAEFDGDEESELPHNQARLRKQHLEDAISFVEWNVNSDNTFNKLPDRQWLRKVKPLLK